MLWFKLGPALVILYFVLLFAEVMFFKKTGFYDF